MLGLFFYLFFFEGLDQHTKQKKTPHNIATVIRRSPISSLALLHTEKQAFQCATLETKPGGKIVQLINANRLPI